MKHPNDCEHIFTGNVIIQDHYPDNRTVITFFEDNYDLGKNHGNSILPITPLLVLLSLTLHLFALEKTKSPI